MSIMIGLETHVQLRTRTKLFCSCANQSEGGPNTSVCPICMGYPGTKPELNEKAVTLASQIALALNCKIADEMWFSRKSYFYPDLPKGFQTTQYEVPLAEGGFVDIIGDDGKTKRIRIRRVHMEEDPAKLDHEGGIVGGKRTLIDYNRAGTPLCEIVTEPDFGSPAEARRYLDYLLSLLSYLEVMDPKAEGVMRSDGNISMNGGERVEIKNITGTTLVEQALKAEFNRQASFINLGKVIERETRLFDDATGRTVTLRKKEAEEDYGYIFEPDLPIIGMTTIVPQVKKEMREMPEKALARLENNGVAKEIASVVVYKPGLVAYYDECIRSYDNPELVSRWLANDFLKSMNINNFEMDRAPAPEKIVSLLKDIGSGKTGEREAKELIKSIVAGKKIDASFAVDEGKIIAEVVASNAKAIADYKAGNEKSIQFLIGEVMKKSRAKIDPNKARELLLKSIR